jgi:hypothetical protein
MQSNNDIVKLNLASGQMYLDGYINIDNKSMYHGNMKVDVEGDVFDLKWETNSVDEILLSHFAMYISFQEMTTLLKRWYNWLKPNGKIIIETGNVKAVAKHILENTNPHEINGSNGVMQLFGWETTAGHKWAWCPETLGDLMFKSGFKDVEVGDGYFHSNPVRDFLIVGTK